MAGRFDGDLFWDLAVGAPGEDVGSAAGAGAVSIVANPGSTPDQALLYQGKPGVAGTAESGDAFGWAVAANDYSDAAGQDSLAMGSPGEDVGSVADAGTLTVLYGLDGANTELLTQGDAAGAVEAGDRFGAALSEPFFHENDVLEDLGVGAPGETVGGRVAAGAGSVLFGAVSGGLGGGGSQLFHQGVSGLGGMAESGDTFGGALGTELG